MYFSDSDKRYYVMSVAHISLPWRTGRHNHIGCLQRQSDNLIQLNGTLNIEYVQQLNLLEVWWNFETYNEVHSSNKLYLYSVLVI